MCASNVKQKCNRRGCCGKREGELKIVLFRLNALNCSRNCGSISKREMYAEIRRRAAVRRERERETEKEWKTCTTFPRDDIRAKNSYRGGTIIIFT